MRILEKNRKREVSAIDEGDADNDVSSEHALLLIKQLTARVPHGQSRHSRPFRPSCCPDASRVETETRRIDRRMEEETGR